jgi:uncharacterized protein YqjF (DUF2071 family)
MFKSINTILQHHNHRPYPLPHPATSWQYYQEWNKVLMLHYQVPIAWIQSLIPKNISIDTFEDKAYVSIVVFTMEHLRPKYLPTIKLLSNFHEINVRTYVIHNNKPGVYFLNIEAEKTLAAMVSKALSGLPYEKSSLYRKQGEIEAHQQNRNFYLQVTYKPTSLIQPKSALELWLTERYCLYLQQDKYCYRYDIQHQEWELKQVALERLYVDYTIANYHFDAATVISAHYAEGIQVLSWPRVQLH